MIKVLSFCAALLAPTSTGLDPHGRALHLKLDADFNTSYDACITTVKQARKYGIDPFISAALMYKETRFSPKLAKRSKLFRKIRRNYGCEGDSGQFIKSSCSAFMLFAPHLVTYLEKNYIDRKSGSDYRKSLRQFLRNNRKRAKIVENMAKRFADMYSRTHTSFVWNSPFQNPERLGPEEPKIAQNDPRYRQNDPETEILIENLRRPRPYDHQRRRLEQKMQYDLQLLYSILGSGCKIEARSRDLQNPEYYVRIDTRSLRETLWLAAGSTSSGHQPHTFQEYNDGRYVLLLNTPKRTIIFTPYGENTYIITIK